MVIRLDSDWKVFSPRPPPKDWWCVFPGVLENNQSVDIFPMLHGLGGAQQYVAANYDAPQEFAYSIRDERWTKYLEHVFKQPAKGQEKMRSNMKLWLGQFICREWNLRQGGGPVRLANF